MKPSKLRYKQAVDAARKYAYGQIEKMPEHFDKRQARIFEKYVGKTAYQKAYLDELDNDVWLAYTGKTREQYMQSTVAQETQD
jgi:hypothetical protein